MPQTLLLKSIPVHPSPAPQAALRAVARSGDEPDFAALIAQEVADACRKPPEKAHAAKGSAPAREDAESTGASAADTAMSNLETTLRNSSFGTSSEPALAGEKQSASPAGDEAATAPDTATPMLPATAAPEMAPDVRPVGQSPVSAPELTVAPDAAHTAQSAFVPLASASPSKPAATLSGAAPAAPPPIAGSGDSSPSPPGVTPKFRATDVTAEPRPDAAINTGPGAPSDSPETGSAPLDPTSRNIVIVASASPVNPHPAVAPPVPTLDAAAPQSEAPPSTPGASSSPPAPVPISRFPFAISAMARDGARRFDISLEPAELGRVDVRLDIEDGEVRAHLVVERPEALQLLRRDAHGLQQAFADAGLRSDSGGISFGLRQDGSSGGHAAYREREEPENAPRDQSGGPELPTLPRPARAISTRAALDIFL